MNKVCHPIDLDGKRRRRFRLPLRNNVLWSKREASLWMAELQHSPEEDSGPKRETLPRTFAGKTDRFEDI
ncbi:hypothetical protein TNIN_144281 [Trichonephila inaurata madagascariensis]|uniref:Uncharacterized protein n=1 Tax=Trichonephila inaurata madagascariensis TaxID=2747483 RepID=A0A8X6WUG0_9ARAC|nr:hypothetical protein TNIN_144281 [Trichonephila inaurata madagascariensis]